ncbi:hypothetical protein X560_0393 [Listeria fleischmannii 1991]|uniref:Uncharacterized protein n=2 Tax=Listeria fleischmannii TaxID=1069827 RepID=A0A2X3HHE7_9LIST|nr:hypothetical protein [Listeria fleischmannii]KMT60973.1 hypothetical protein X560_0393 [Listeria fleischmannii 1991]SQC70584.1 Uncharacterised protein [Listeria fleischmannii subsp. fleischmannii]
METEYIRVKYFLVSTPILIAMIYVTYNFSFSALLKVILTTSFAGILLFLSDEEKYKEMKKYRLNLLKNHLMLLGVAIFSFLIFGRVLFSPSDSEILNFIFRFFIALDFLALSNLFSVIVFYLFTSEKFLKKINSEL